MGALTTENELLWPTFHGPSDLAAVERVPLSERGLPASTYELVRRAASLWRDRPALSELPDAESFRTPFVRTFAELGRDVHRAAAVLVELAVRRGQAVAVISVNCAEMVPLLLAAEAVGIYAPINPGLTAEHATELVRRSGAKVIVASGPELDPDVWAQTRAIAANTGARAVLALRPTAAPDEPPALEPLDGTDVAYLAERMSKADDAALPVPPPTSSEIASYLHTGGTTGTPKLAARTHANEVSNAWMMRANDVLDQDSVIFAALPLFHTNALVVTVLAPLLKGQHVVWGGPLGYRDLPLFQNFWKIVNRYRIASMSRRPHGLRGPRASPGRRRHLKPEAADRRRRAAPPCSGHRVRGPHRRRTMRRLWPDRGHVCQRAQLARRSPPGNGRAAPALPASARCRHRRGHRRVDVPA